MVLIASRFTKHKSLLILMSILSHHSGIYELINCIKFLHCVTYLLYSVSTVYKFAYSKQVGGFATRNFAIMRNHLTYIYIYVTPYIRSLYLEHLFRFSFITLHLRDVFLSCKLTCGSAWDIHKISTASSKSPSQTICNNKIMGGAMRLTMRMNDH